MITLSNKIKVSVCIVAYNQEKYIAQCLQSIVDQKVDFDFEVLVGDDCSTDATRQIITEFAEKYPGKIKPIFHPQNIGPYKNYEFVHGKARGEYIAHLDGDDFALPGKLQHQVDYLDSHPDCNILWHRMLISNETTGVVVPDLIDIREIPCKGFGRPDLLRFLAVGINSSKMYRSNLKKVKLPPFPIIDTFLNVEQVCTGTATFVSDQPYGVYRVGIGIASSGNTTATILQKTLLYFSEKYPEYKREICTAALVITIAALKNKRWVQFRLNALLVIRTFRLKSISDIWEYRKLFPMFRMPKNVR